VRPVVTKDDTWDDPSMSAGVAFVADNRQTEGERQSASLRVAVADDSLLVREGVARILAERGFDVVACARDAEELVAAVRRHEPDVCVVDVRMPPTLTDEGSRAARLIRAEGCTTGVLLVSQVVEATQAIALIGDRADGFGYLLKDRIVEIDDFVDAVRRVALGGSAIDPVVIAQLVGRSRDDDPLAELTPREREVLELMAEGLSNHGIRARLVLSPKTVETHVNSIFWKLGLLPAGEEHRRVCAVLTFLAASP
jgi:DNA-binding NarL/FixJ family response regulator